MILNEFNWSDEQIAEYAAEFCYQPHSENDKRALAAKWLIEFLSLPHTERFYTKDEMKKMILKEIAQKQWK